MAKQPPKKPAPKKKPQPKGKGANKVILNAKPERVDKRGSKRKATESGLTPLEELFAQHYVTHRNAARAAQEAGSTAKNLSQAGYELLNKPDVHARVRELIKARVKSLHSDKDEIIENMREVYERCMQAKPVLDFVTGEPTGEWQFDPKGAHKAMELVARVANLTTPSNNIGVKVTNNVKSGGVSEVVFIKINTGVPVAPSKWWRREQMERINAHIAKDAAENKAKAKEQAKAFKAAEVEND